MERLPSNHHRNSGDQIIMEKSQHEKYYCLTRQWRQCLVALPAASCTPLGQNIEPVLRIRAPDRTIRHNHGKCSKPPGGANGAQGPETMVGSPKQTPAPWVPIYDMALLLQLDFTGPVHKVRSMKKNGLRQIRDLPTGASANGLASKVATPEWLWRERLALSAMDLSFGGNEVSIVGAGDTACDEACIYQNSPPTYTDRSAQMKTECGQQSDAGKS